jgi:alkaline phosphatase D
MTTRGREGPNPAADEREPADAIAPTGAVTRRQLLALGAGAMASGALVACADDSAGAGSVGPRFQHGVASGDPLPDGVILWTRLTTPDRGAPAEATWELAAEPTFAVVLQTGAVTTDTQRDFTVKVDVRGLAPATTYYYRFRSGAEVSLVGRTRTAPTGQVARLRFGVASCSSYAQGYFHAYRALARRADLAAVIHLGDYIYEYGSGQYGNARPHEPASEALTLADYRTRHAQYKRDPDLQAVHRQHPFITIWDDHESANNAWRDGAENHTPATEGAWAVRKAAAQRAYSEWMPIRDQDDVAKIWRKLSFGDLVDLVLLDTRLWGRSETSGGLFAPMLPEDPTRSLLGDDQEAWLDQQIAGSTARWKLIAQQVMVANLILMPATGASATVLANPDQWHGYPTARRRFLEFLRSSGHGNVVILTGDIHSSWANELVVDPMDPTQYDPSTGVGAIAVELVTPAITSPGLPPLFQPAVDAARPYNPHLRWFDLVRQGYMVLDVTPERTQGAWFLYTDITKATPLDETFAAAWSVATGSTRLLSDAAAAPPETGPPLAP